MVSSVGNVNVNYPRQPYSVVHNIYHHIWK